MRGKQIQFPTTDFPTLYDRVVPADHFLRQIRDRVDFTFVYRALDASYPSHIGRPPTDPVLLFKYLFLKEYYGLSDEETVERSRYDMSFKYFLGLMPEEDIINPSTLSRFRTGRFADEGEIRQLMERLHGAIGEAGIPL